MTTHLFNVTVKVHHDKQTHEITILRGFRAKTKHDARRHVLDDMLKQGYQVISVKPLEEKSV